MCFKIFLARLLDVSLGTIKTLFIVKEKKLIASLISFVEILIWFVVAKEALNTNINSILIPVSYSLGYATGTYIGILLSSHLINGNLTVHVISSNIRKKDINYLKDNGFGLTNISISNSKKYLIIEIKKKDFNRLKELIDEIDNKAFLIVNETKFIQNGFI